MRAAAQACAGRRKNGDTLTIIPPQPPPLPSATSSPTTFSTPFVIPYLQDLT